MKSEICSGGQNVHREQRSHSTQKGCEHLDWICLTEILMLVTGKRCTDQAVSSPVSHALCLKPFRVISVFHFSLLEGRHCKSNGGDFSTVILFCFFPLHLWGVQLPCCTPDKLLLLHQQELILVISGSCWKMSKVGYKILPLHKTVYTSVRVTKSIFCFPFKQVVSNTFEKKNCLLSD